MILRSALTWFARLMVQTVLGLLLLASAIAAPVAELGLNAEQQSWLDANQHKVFTVGFDPFAGIDSFEYRGKQQGILPALLKEMQTTLGLRLEPARVTDWDDAYTQFTQGQVDVLYGANPTPERLKTMVFTQPAQKYPYVVFARKDSTIQTLGDLDKKRVGFIANDFVREQLPKEYRNIAYQASEFPDQEMGLNTLAQDQIDGFVTAGGGVEHEYLLNHPDLALIAVLQPITSDMTFAVLKTQAPLAGILNQYLQRNEERVKTIAIGSTRMYTRKILGLTGAELAWLDSKAEAVVGVAQDYLPFDYYNDGKYQGIAGETLQRIAEISGIHFKVVSGPFSDLYTQAQAGTIDVLNMAKTEDRLPYFFYPRPISTERDIIVGHKDSAPVQDVYGLEGKRVAVIKGFWHEEYLRKNLKSVQIVKTQDIMESLRLVRQDKVDYMIENPTVVEFYINGLGYTDLVKRGNTSKDSFVYFGVTQKQPELASIMDKALTLIKFEDMKYAGLQSVPPLQNEQSRQLAQVVVGLLVALAGVGFVTLRIVRSLANQKAETQFLKEREHLLYTDPLTGFYNRNYFSHIHESLQKGDCPQVVVVADLNNLKRANDTHGHAAGDALLVLFAQAVRAQFAQALCFRMGGDEFLMVMNSSMGDAMADSVKELKARCQVHGHQVSSDITIHASAAMGFAVRTSTAESLDSCIAKADTAMYEEKIHMKKRSTDTAITRTIP
jgi:diguanylate cyclase (GGDEF)-like protein